MRHQALTGLGFGVVPQLANNERRVYPARDPDTKLYDPVVLAIADRTRKPVDLIDLAVFLTRRDVYASTNRPALDSELLEAYPLAVAGGDARMEMEAERAAMALVNINE